MKLPAKKIVLYDCICNLCNHAASFIMKHDKKREFVFISFQSAEGKKIMESNHIKTAGSVPDTLYYFENGKLYVKSTAIIKICLHLGGLWKILLILFIIPEILRDKIYDLISGNRYRIFGAKGSCSYK